MTWKNFIISTLLLIAIVVTLSAVDYPNSQGVSGVNSTSLKVNVIDMQTQKAVHNAVININGTIFFTDNKGYSPTIEVEVVANNYDASITDWFVTNVIVSKSGFVSCVVVQCVIYVAQDRQLTISLYPQESDSPPYICYVESPPDSYLQQLIDQSESK